jgi:hypothetical protein
MGQLGYPPYFERQVASDTVDAGTEIVKSSINPELPSTGAGVVWPSGRALVNLNTY